jgi:hypothetical protein
MAIAGVWTVLLAITGIIITIVLYFYESMSFMQITRGTLHTPTISIHKIVLFDEYIVPILALKLI